jgi:LysM repeat protein
MNMASMRAAVAAAARPAGYTVRLGDTLSAIAGRVYHDTAAWPVLYWANRRTVRWADVILAGQQLAVPAEPAVIPAGPSQLGPAVPRPAAAVSRPARTHAPSYVPARATLDVQSAGSYSGGAPGSFASCVIARESGGNATAVNAASGAGGLYGFLPSTWASLGYSGLPENAPAWEQTQAFGKLYAEAGASPWSAYDGC